MSDMPTTLDEALIEIAQWRELGKRWETAKAHLESERDGAIFQAQRWKSIARANARAIDGIVHERVNHIIMKCAEVPFRVMQ